MLEALGGYTPLITSFLVLFAIYLIMALSLNLEYGYSGIPNFGHVFFMSVGAYVSGNLTAHVIYKLSGATADFCSGQGAYLRTAYASQHPMLAIGLFILSLIVGAIVGGIFGYLGSYPGLRLKETFLAITLIFIGEIGRIIARNEKKVACGLTGLTGVPNPFCWIDNVNFRSVLYTVVVLMMAAATYIYVQRLTQSPFGRLLKAMRDNDLAAMVLGKEIPRARGIVMVIGSALAAVAGVLRTFYIQGVVADDFIPLITFTVLSMVILGGVANNLGVLIGTLVMTTVDHFLSPSFLSIIGFRVEFDITYVKYVITGLIMILVLMFRPEGAMPEKPVKTPLLELSKSKEWEVEEELRLNSGDMD